MGLYNFEERFVPKILSGEKQHTIRGVRKHADRPGKTMHLYTGLRHKGAKLLMRVRCDKVEQIEIKNGAFFDTNHASVVIDGIELDQSEREALARRDGFDDFEQMMQFWDGRLPFVGHIIHWRQP
jgi:hypothetical protein